MGIETLGIVQIVICGLAVYRVTWLLTRDDGPFDVLAKFRNLFGQRTWIGRGLNCPVCVSFWLSLLVTIVFAGSWADWLAIAGLSCWLTRF